MPRLPICPSHSRAGVPCESRGRFFEGHCKIHQDYRLRHDAEYRRRYEASHPIVAVADPVAVAVADPVADPVAVAVAVAVPVAVAVAVAVPVAVAVADPVADPVLVVAPLVAEADLRTHLPVLMEHWIRQYDGERLHTFEAVVAYARLRYQPISPLTTALFAATQALVRNEADALGLVQTALAAYPAVPNHQILALFPPADPYRIGIRRRFAGHAREARERERVRVHLEEQARLDEERRAARARRAEEIRAHRAAGALGAAFGPMDDVMRRLLQFFNAALEEEGAALDAFRAPLDQRALVFARDPEGGVDLRALAADSQSVHRSSVQTTAKKTIDALLARPVPADQDTIREVTSAFTTGFKEGVNRDNLIRTFREDCRIVRAFNVSYKDVVDRVWAFIRGHKEKRELVLRLAQEIAEGMGMCNNGKMARLTNVLQGFDEDLLFAPPKELFHDRMAQVSKMPAADRIAAARGLFVEFAIPEAEQAPWIEALED